MGSGGSRLRGRAQLLQGGRPMGIYTSAVALWFIAIALFLIGAKRVLRQQEGGRAHKSDEPRFHAFIVCPNSEAAGSISTVV
jgi:hypothetical protein